MGEQKRIRNRTFVITLLAFVMLAGLSCYLLYARFDDWAGQNLCKNELISRESQPDQGKYDVVTFTRDCGATTASSYQVSILPRDKELMAEFRGNVFISNDTVTASWLDKSHIQLDGASLEVFKQKTKYKGIEIIYGSK